MRTSDEQDLLAQQEVSAQERMQEQSAGNATEKKTIAIEFTYDTETGLIQCPNPTYLHAALLGKMSIEVALINHRMGRGEWTCG